MDKNAKMMTGSNTVGYNGRRMRYEMSEKDLVMVPAKI